MQPNACPTLPRQGMLFAPPIAPATVLTLPRLAAEIPRSFHLDGERTEPCILAKALATEGVLKPGQWRGEVVDCCISALTAWTASFKAFNASLQVTFDVESVDLDCDERERGGFVLTVSHPADLVYTLMEKVRKLEWRHKGAGHAVMAALNYCDVSIYRPWTAWHDCRWFHWRGESNEAEYSKLMEAETGDKDEAEVKVKNWTDEMPRWAWDPGPISLERLKAVARKVRKPKMFDPLIALREFEPGVNELRAMRNVVDTVTPCILEWAGYGMVTRIFDDVMNHIYESGDGTNLDALAVLRFTNCEESVRAAINDLGKLLQHMTVIREVIEQVGTPREA